MVEDSYQACSIWEAARAFKTHNMVILMLAEESKPSSRGDCVMSSLTPGPDSQAMAFCKLGYISICMPPCTARPVICSSTVYPWPSFIATNCKLNQSELNMSKVQSAEPGAQPQGTCKCRLTTAALVEKRSLEHHPSMVPVGSRQ